MKFEDRYISDAAKYLIKQNRKAIDLLNTKYVDDEAHTIHNLGITTEKDILLDEIEILEDYLAKQITQEDVYEILLTVPLFSNNTTEFYTLKEASLNNVKGTTMRVLKQYLKDNKLDADMTMVSATVDKFIKEQL